MQDPFSFFFFFFFHALYNVYTVLIATIPTGMRAIKSDAVVSISKFEWIKMLCRVSLWYKYAARMRIMLLPFLSYVRCILYIFGIFNSTFHHRISFMYYCILKKEHVDILVVSTLSQDSGTFFDMSESVPSLSVHIIAYLPTLQ